MMHGYHYIYFVFTIGLKCSFLSISFLLEITVVTIDSYLVDLRFSLDFHQYLV